MTSALRRDTIGINAGQAEIHRRLFELFIFRDDEPLGFVAVFRPQALKRLGDVVERVNHAFPSEEESITLFHGSASSSLSGRGFQWSGLWQNFARNSEGFSDDTPNYLPNR